MAGTKHVDGCCPFLSRIILPVHHAPAPAFIFERHHCAMAARPMGWLVDVAAIYHTFSSTMSVVRNKL